MVRKRWDMKREVRIFTDKEAKYLVGRMWTVAPLSSPLILRPDISSQGGTPLGYLGWPWILVTQLTLHLLPRSISPGPGLLPLLALR